MSFHPLPSIPSLEPLEARLLLSADALTPMVPTFAGTLELSAGETVSLAQGSGETSQAFTDAGDYYWADGRQISLLRATNEVVVSIASGENGEELVQQWTQPDGPLAGYGMRFPLNDNLFVLGDSASSLDAASALESISAGGKVAWSGPTFICEENGSRLWATDEVIVKIRPGVDPAAFFAEFGNYRQLFMSQYVMSVQGGSMGSLQTANALANNPDVEWASPNFYQDFRVSTNDTLYSSQWHLNNTGQTGAQSDADADVAEAWSTTTGSANIVIAVLDNGVQTDHPDLNIYTNPGEIAGNGIDDDGNGFIDDVNGWDFTGTGDNNPNPTTAFDNHGTAVAGVAAAHGSNGLGVTGVSQHSTILPIKIATDTTGDGGGFVSNATIAQAVYYAGGFSPDGSHPETWRGADIINCSWGGGSPDTSLTDAFDYVAEHGRDGLGCVIFVAAGNSATGYKTYVDPAITTGTWFFQWEYAKNASGTAGDDSVWLANVGLPDGTRQTFSPTSDLTGWQTGGNAIWTINTDATRAYFTEFVGGRQLRAGSIGNNQVTVVRSPTVTVGAGGGDFTFNAWVSSQLNGDFLNVWGYDGTWHLLFHESGVPTITTAVSYPASLDSVIAVGASTDWDYRAAYSQYGSALDFVAPSSGGYAGITTTDRTGSAGYNPSGDYTDTAASAFGGTSAAAPLAAGIGALLLSANPGLTATQIRDIMRASADHIGSVTYTSGFNSYYGYGRVNAAAALDCFGPNITPDITDVSPDPRGTSVSNITITFSESVSNFDLTDLTLKREGVAISWQGTGVSLSADDDYDTFTLSGLSGLTGDPGKYELVLTAEDSFISDAAGDYLSGDATDVWYMNAINSGSGNDTVKLSMDGTLTKVDINDGATVYWLDPAGFPILNVNTDGGNDTLTVDLSEGNPIPADGIKFDGGTGSDTLEIIGSAGDDTVTLTGGTPAASSYGIGVANVEAVSASLGEGGDTLTVDFSAGNPVPAAGISYDGGDGTDTLEVVGSTGSDTVTLTGGTPGASSHEIGVANVEAFIVSLGAGADTLNLKNGAFEFAAGDFSLGDGEDILSITDATVTLNDNVGANVSDDSDTVETHGDDANLTFNVTQYLKALRLFDESLVTLDGDGGDAIVTTELKINENQTLAATLDLTDNNLVVDYTGYDSPLMQISNWVKSGANFDPDLGEMFWNGPGITSSVAAADSIYQHQLLALGVRQAVDAGAYDMPPMTSLEGVDINDTSVVVKFTWMGDVDLDGQVTLKDYYVLDYYFTYGITPDKAGWWTGDLNGDGHVTLKDYYLIDVGYTYQEGTL